MLIDSFGNKVEIEKIKDKRIIMYGASTRNQKAIEELGIENNVTFFIDSNEERNGQVSEGYKIYSPAALNNHPDCIILSVLVSHFEEIMSVLNNNGIKDCLFYYPEFFDIEKVFFSNREVLQIKRNYQYVHIFSNDKFVIPFYQMLEERFPIEEHLLIVAYRIKDDFSKILPFLMEKCKKYYNVLIVDDVHGITSTNPTNRMRLIPKELDCNEALYSDKIKQICSQANKIILHSAFWGNETKKFVHALTINYAAKMIWICFGGDAYFDRDSFEVKEILTKVGICSLTVATYDIVKKNYGICGKFDRNEYYIYIPKSMVRQPPSHDSVHILLGHAAFEHVNHKDGLKLLQKFKKENIKIYCPLSYGSEKYRNSIIQIGKELYGDKFIPLLSYLNQKDYFEFLQSIDVAVFPLKRVAAESTFLLLKAANVKIYADITVMGYMNNEKFVINDINKIQSETFDEFISHIRQPSYCIDEINDYMVNEWKHFFED